jgi:CheY-like chemotaxis protein
VSYAIKSILLIDDDLDDQLLFEEALSEAGASTVYLSALNGEDALLKLNAGTLPIPSLIFLDVNMPRMNGIDCLKALRQSDKLVDIPILMFSTSCSVDYQNECFELGAVGYIEKPNDYRELCAKLALILKEGLQNRSNNMPLTL